MTLLKHIINNNRIKLNDTFENENMHYVESFHSEAPFEKLDLREMQSGLQYQKEKERNACMT